MGRLPVALLTLLCLAPAAITALPPQEHPSSPSPWRWFTNTLISKIWQLPDPQSPVRTTPDGNGRTENSQAAARYGQDIVLRFNLSSVDEAQAIADAAQDLYLDIWEFNENWVDIRLAKDIVPSLLNLLPSSLGSAHAPLIPESALTSLISSTTPSSSHGSFAPTVRTPPKDLFFSDYQPLSVIYPWLRLLSSMFPTHARVITIGHTYEGREISALRVGSRPKNNANPSGPRKTILVTGGSHAREWISTSSVNYVAYSMITSYGKSSAWTTLMNNFDWVFVPSLNPDGYEYSWSNDRLWRKTRQPTPLRFCKGIDLDRTFEYQFDTGTASNPCSESYAGQEPWQATEAGQLRDWVNNQTASGAEFIAYLDLHSYSQQVLYPYSYTCSFQPPTLENLEELALGLAKAMRLASSHGLTYKATAACDGNVIANSRGEVQMLPRLENGGGSALDWFYHEIKVKYAYQIKLRDTGSYGFLLPKEHIVPSGKEVFGAVAYLGRYLLGEIGMLEEGMDLDVKEPGAEDPKQSGGQDQVNDSDPIADESSQDSIQWELRRRR